MVSKYVTVNKIPDGVIVTPSLFAEVMRHLSEKRHPYYYSRDLQDSVTVAEAISKSAFPLVVFAYSSKPAEELEPLFKLMQEMMLTDFGEYGLTVFVATGNLSCVTLHELGLPAKYDVAFTSASFASQDASACKLQITASLLRNLYPDSWVAGCIDLDLMTPESFKAVLKTAKSLFFSVAITNTTIRSSVKYVKNTVNYANIKWQLYKLDCAVFASADMWLDGLSAVKDNLMLEHHPLTQ
jgi:hypothetical protein